LNEIKNEIKGIENTVANIPEINITINVINEIVAGINETLNNEAFGLNEIKNEIRAIENAVFSPVFGLNEIKNEIKGIENTVNNQAEVNNNINNVLNEINGIVNNPVFGLNEIKNEIRAIENAVFSPVFGLNEIKNEIKGIENTLGNLAFNCNISEFNQVLNNINNTVTLINNSVNSNVFGLNEIKNEIRAIENAVLSPIFGLNEIKNEIRGIENTVGLINSSVNNDNFGLNEIKNEIRLLVNQIPGQSNCVTTGAVIRDRQAENLLFKAINTTPNQVNVTMTIWNYDVCPSICFTSLTFNTASRCSNDVDIRIFTNNGKLELNNYEITVCGIVPGVYVFSTTYGPNTSFLASNTYRSGDFLPVVFNRSCSDPTTLQSNEIVVH
jgi:uncharacterized coiled-coil DUF342 family protein